MVKVSLKATYRYNILSLWDRLLQVYKVCLVWLTLVLHWVISISSLANRLHVDRDPFGILYYSFGLRLTNVIKCSIIRWMQITNVFNIWTPEERGETELNIEKQ